MDNTEIYYFTGTGNSLFVAKELQKRIEGAKLIPIVSLLNYDIIETDADIVGLVFPVHGMTVPIPVKRFVEKLKLKSANYIFAVATRAGTKCFAFTRINKILKAKNRALSSHFVLNMPCNDPKFKVYEVPTKDKITEFEIQIQKQVDIIGKTILNRESIKAKDSNFIPSGFLLDRLVLLGMKFAELDGAKGYFCSDSKCTGCGICEKVCLSGKVKLIDSKPIWNDEVKCYLCYACINFCPNQAAQIKTKWYMKSYTDKNGRYPHPYALVDDIAEQKKELS